MAIKKKKLIIPKYDDGEIVQLADSNMLQGYDSGLSSTPEDKPLPKDNSSKFGMAGGIMNGIGSAMPSKVELTSEQKALEQGKDQLAQSNPFIGMFRGIEKMANGIGGAIGGKKGEETVRSITDPFQAGLGHIKDRNLTAGQKALQFLPLGNLALPELDPRMNITYNPKNAGTGISFGDNTNQLIEMALGGFVKKYENGGEFKQYQAPTHEEGGQMIDKNKNPTNNPNNAVAEVEKKENSYKDYIFSDTLEYKPGITFSKQSKKINDRLKDRQDIISKNSLDLELTELMKKNEQVKQTIEQNQNLTNNIMKLGGIIPKARGGLELNPSDPDYFTKLMQQNNILSYGNIGPTEDRSTLAPVYKNTNTNTIDNSKINEPLFKGNLPSGPQQDANGIDIEKPGDDFGKGIAKNSSEYLNQAKEDSEFYKKGQVGTPIKEEKKKQFSPEAIAGYGIKGAELLGHAIQAFKKPELVNPVHNPEENAIKNLMSKRKIDNQDLLNELELQNTATKQDIADNSTSVGTMISNLQKLHANNVDTIAKITSQTQQTNNAYRGEEAQILNNLGAQKVQAQTYAEELNTRAKANVQNQRDKFLKESIGGLGDFLLKKDYVNKENQFQMNILKSKGINFSPTDIKEWSKTDTDIIEFIGELESETDIEKRKVLMENNKKKYLAKGGKEEIWNELIGKGLTNKYLK